MKGVHAATAHSPNGRSASATHAAAASGSSLDDLVFPQLPQDLRTSDVVALSLDAASALVTRVRMATNPPDVLVEVPLDSARTWDFHRASELIDLGRTLAGRALDAAGR